MMFFYPESETGYYEDEESYYAYDREMEAREADRQARLEGEAEEMLAMAWAGDEGLTTQPPQLNTGNVIDPETGCTVAEMEEADKIPSRVLKIGDLDPSEPASQVTFPPEMSVGQTITAMWGRGARRRKGVA